MVGWLCGSLSLLELLELQLGFHLSLLELALSATQRLRQAGDLARSEDQHDDYDDHYEPFRTLQQQRCEHAFVGGGRDSVLFKDTVSERERHGLGGRYGVTVEIRDCLRANLGEVYEIERTSFPHPYDLDVFQAYLMRVEYSGFDGFLVAVDGDRVVGYVIFECGRKGLIVSMAVRTGSRRKKVGTLLLKEALRRLSSKCQEVTLQVGVTNTGARELYRSFGFSVVNLLPRYYPDGEDAYLMEASGLQHDATQ
jgi:ribosomal-protein-alanine N-acetyltransferase